ncbi:transcriptional repressor [Mycetocola tolaasinivorans]|uniref:Transcriptional repressor n=1 Tax=Mycetocola tolaasinivorans TaxID=76635 RepID=A0A3L7A8W9_9MICO|nr:Fur family transcriptional regulator [Mycetocola tolaasinivorans]RLP76031.1 transcriptional repressor [Mycetocola tolaasinivorans]
MTTATPEALADAIRGAGLRLTAPRLAVMRAVGEKSHVDAGTVFDRVVTDLPDTSLQAVYGVLSALTDAGLLRRIEPAGSPARYERRVDDNHHHIVCTRCGAIADVDCVVGHAPCMIPGETSGFSVHTAEVTFWGLCSACQIAVAAQENEVADTP